MTEDWHSVREGKDNIDPIKESVIVLLRIRLYECASDKQMTYKS